MFVWLVVLLGCRGEQGPPGANGVDGTPGRDGVDGIDGAPGNDGLDGVDGQDAAVAYRWVDARSQDVAPTPELVYWSADGYLWDLSAETGEVIILKQLTYWTGEYCTGDAYFTPALPGMPVLYNGIWYVRRNTALSVPVTTLSSDYDGTCYAGTSGGPFVARSEHRVLGDTYEPPVTGFEPPLRPAPW